MITARIIADSVNVAGNRLTTFVATYPRFIHSELMTHRMFSRNAASSRAIPVTRLIQMVESEPAMPVHWGKNQKGMQANEELDQELQEKAKTAWLNAVRSAVDHARYLNTLGVHKQIVNRILEPFAHMTTIVTATEFGNFFNLRADKDAQPEFQELAFKMLNEYITNKPVLKKPGEWHLPFCDQYLDSAIPLNKMLMIATARCARVSYLTFEGDIAPEKDYALHDQLKDSGHWSPFEHPACAMSASDVSGNFRGWQQYRKMFMNEHKQIFDAQELIEKRYGSKN